MTVIEFAGPFKVFESFLLLLSALFAMSGHPVSQMST